MLTLPTNPELENRLREEANKRGLEASDFVLQLIESFSNVSPDTTDRTEKRQVKPLAELIGADSGHR
jgi:hypothetical protein